MRFYRSQTTEEILFFQGKTELIIIESDDAEGMCFAQKIVSGKSKPLTKVAHFSCGIA